jgi:uncharacterized membrane protein YphA (DoxX/SURF4 family)
MTSAKFKAGAVWALSGLLALMYVSSGAMKFVNPEAAQKFAAWGYPDWFRVLVAVVEIAGGVLLLVPRVAWLAAGALAVVMVGAAVTHFRTAGEEAQAAVPLVFLAALLLVGYARRPRLTARAV